MGTGYKGRMGIYELLVLNNQIKTEILKGSDANAILDVALKCGFKTMRNYGKQKVIEGFTTPDEVLRVC
jgi:general secretion pathway protein E